MTRPSQILLTIVAFWDALMTSPFYFTVIHIALSFVALWWIERDEPLWPASPSKS